MAKSNLSSRHIALAETDEGGAIRATLVPRHFERSREISPRWAEGRDKLCRYREQKPIRKQIQFTRQAATFWP
jgi:hypothetical protein